MTNHPSPELDAFEERLLADLKAVVGAQAAAAPPTPGGLGSLAEVARPATA